MKKILLVEDNAILAMAKQQELGRYNYATSHVTTGEKAVDLVCHQNEPIDLILMDIDLGSGIDGTEAARQILEYKEIPIVFLSNHEESEIVEKTEKITSYGYVVKSSSITVLDASIKMAFKLYESSTREKEKDNELRRNEERLSLAMDAAEHAFWDWNITTGDVYLSPRWYTMLGYEPGELPMRFDTWINLLHHDSKDVTDHIYQHVKNAEPFTEEFQLRCKDGSYKWIMGQGKSYEFDRNNHPTRIVGIHTDITEKKKVEDALRLSEELLNETGEMVKTGGWEVDVASATVYWTKATKAIYEVPEDFEPTIDGAMSYFPGESGKKLREAYRLAVEEGLDYDLELDFITAKGNYLKVRDIGRAVIQDGKCRKVYGVFQDITEIKETEAALIESRDKYKSLYNNSPFLMMEGDADTYEIISCNTAMAKGLGSTPEMLKGKRFIDLFPEQVWKVRESYIQKALKEKKMQIFEDERAGRYYRNMFIPRLHGKRRLVQTITTDITDRKRAEEERRKSDERFLIAQDISPDGFSIFNPVRDDQYRIIDFTWVYQNSAMAQFNGTDSQKVVGRRFLDIFPGAKDTQFIGKYKQVAVSGKPTTFEDSYVGETMKRRSWFRITVVPMDENIAILAHDITEQKKAENRLKVSEDKYRSIFENSVLGIFRSTPEGKYEIVNKAFARILGFNSPKKMLNEVTDISDLYKYPEDRERIKREFAEKGYVEDYEVLANHPENEIAWISINASQRQYPDGFFYYEGTIQDITERKLAEEELRQALNEKDFLMKELNHRVKNSLLMASSLIKLKDSRTDIDLSDIQKQIEAISLIHEKLYQSESVTEINCKDYFGDLLHSALPSFTKRKVQIEKRIEDITLPTKTSMSLGLIINEIATNAIKHGFTDNEEAVFSITLKKDKENKQYELILANNGNPFPENVDIDSTDTLGLHLISAFVTQLNGTIELQRKPNPMFTIRFPIED